MKYDDRLVTAPDGRDIEVATMGSPSGSTVFFHHGTPGSMALVKLFAPLTERGDLFLVTMSRAGYGRSTRLEGRNIAAAVDDARAVLDALGRDEYAVAGWSGGGPHALACAALDAPRCIAAWSLAGVAPMSADFDWTEGMGPENLEEFALSKEGGPKYEAHLRESGDLFSSATRENVIDIFGGLLSEVDKASMAGDDVRELMAAAFRHAFAHGWRGLYDDDQAFMVDWGFDPTTITVPVAVWFGNEDLMVPPTHGQWLARSIATATSSHYRDDGHMSLILNHFDELSDDISQAFA